MLDSIQDAPSGVGANGNEACAKALGNAIASIDRVHVDEVEPTGDDALGGSHVALGADDEDDALRPLALTPPPIMEGMVRRLLRKEMAATTRRLSVSTMPLTLLAPTLPPLGEVIVTTRMRMAATVTARSLKCKQGEGSGDESSSAHESALASDEESSDDSKDSLDEGDDDEGRAAGEASETAAKVAKARADDGEVEVNDTAVKQVAVVEDKQLTAEEGKQLMVNTDGTTELDDDFRFATSKATKNRLPAAVEDAKVDSGTTPKVEARADARSTTRES